MISSQKAVVFQRISDSVAICLSDIQFQNNNLLMRLLNSQFSIYNDSYPMKRIKILITVLLFLFAGTAAAKDNPAHLLKTLPPKINGFVQFDAVKSYNDPAWGASVGYNYNNTVVATVYLYDLGIAEITEQILAAATSQTQQEIATREKAGAYLDVVKVSEKKGKVAIDMEQYATLRTLVYTYRVADTGEAEPYTVTSFLYIAAVADHILKFRITYYIVVNDTILTQTNNFVHRVIKQLAAAPGTIGDRPRQR